MGTAKSSNLRELVGKLVLVRWLDAYSSNGNKFNSKGIKPTVSPGWIVRKSKRFTYVSHFWDGVSKEFHGPYTAIPNDMIVEVMEGVVL